MCVCMCLSAEFTVLNWQAVINLFISIYGIEYSESAFEFISVNICYLNFRKTTIFNSITSKLKIY